MAMRICVNCGADLSVIRMVACCDDPLPDDIVEMKSMKYGLMEMDFSQKIEDLIRLIRDRKAKNEDFGFLSGIHTPGDFPGLIMNDAIRAYHTSLNHAISMFNSVSSLYGGWSWGRDHITGEFISVKSGPGHETVRANEKDPARSMLILCLIMIKMET